MTRLLRSLLVLPLLVLPLLVLGLVALGGGPASAHDTLTGTTPADDATVETVEELRLTFSGDISDLGAQVSVTGGAGGTLVDGLPRVEGSALVQDTADLAPGDYEVVWRVTSADGHPISGAFGFTVSGAAQTSGPTTEEPAPTPVATPPASDPATTTASVPTTGPATTAPVAGGAGGVPGWAWAVVGLAAVLLVGLLARTWVRGRR